MKLTIEICELGPRISAQAVDATFGTPAGRRVVTIVRGSDSTGLEIRKAASATDYTVIRNIAEPLLRASHRRLDAKLSTPYRPYHTHDRKEPLKPGQVVELDVELWPTSIVVPKGHRVALTVRGKDYEYEGEVEKRLSNFKNELTGCGPFLHNDPRDRPMKTFGGKVTLHAGPRNPSYILLPIIPRM